LDYKLEIAECDISNTRFVGLEICATGKQRLSVVQGTLISSSIPFPVTVITQWLLPVSFSNCAEGFL
jgi:hypothetical protein